MRESPEGKSLPGIFLWWDLELEFLELEILELEFLELGIWSWGSGAGALELEFLELGI
jgi:hypothetical protein